MACDCSVTPKYFTLKAPKGIQFDFHTITVGMKDLLFMGASFFGSIAQLDNGLVFRQMNGEYTNHWVIVNNTGFLEMGFNVQSVGDKVGYGLVATKNYLNTNGAVIRIDGRIGDELQVIVQDDISAMDSLAVVAIGHVVEGE